jgi:SAM-dependent methyltransferase
MLIMLPHKQIFARILSNWVTQLPVDGLILEIGCGLGAWIEMISQHGRRVVGLDIDKQACSIASAQIGSECAGIVLYAGGALPFRENSFEGVYAHEVIEHVDDDKGFIAEAYRVLKDGGSLILTTPNGNREPIDKRKHRAHVRHYLPDQLDSHLREQGFRIESLYWRMHPLCGMLDDALSQIGTRLLQTQAVQPGLTHWVTESQTRPNRLILTLFRIIAPLISFAVTIEFELFKTAWEARNMIFVAQKGARTNL